MEFLSQNVLVDASWKWKVLDEFMQKSASLKEVLGKTPKKKLSNSLNSKRSKKVPVKTFCSFVEV